MTTAKRTLAVVALTLTTSTELEKGNYKHNLEIEIASTRKRTRTKLGINNSNSSSCLNLIRKMKEKEASEMKGRKKASVMQINDTNDTAEKETTARHCKERTKDFHLPLLCRRRRMT